jgi:hypothetical protein
LHWLAGRAVIATIEGLAVTKLSFELKKSEKCSITIREPHLAFSRSVSLDRVPEEVASVIRALLAGPAAGIRYGFGYFPMDFNLADPFVVGEQVVWRAICLAGKATYRSVDLIHFMWDDVVTATGDEKIWAAIEAVAQDLLAKRELSDFEILEIVYRYVDLSSGSGSRPEEGF